MKKKIFSWKKLTLVLLSFVAILMGKGGNVYAATTTMSPNSYTRHDYNSYTTSNPVINNVTGTGNIGGKNIDDVWYYVVPNYKSSAITVTFDLYGCATLYSGKDYVRNAKLHFTDSIPANTTRMYLYTVFTADKSYDAAEVHSIDIVLNGSSQITSTSNARSLVAVTMAHGSVNNFYLKKEEIETGQNLHFYGESDESQNQHYIQFVYPSSSRTISLHTWVQSGNRPISTPRSQRAVICSFLSGFNAQQVNTIYHSNSGTWYKSSNVTVDTSQSSPVYTGESCGHIEMTYDKQTQQANNVSVSAKSLTYNGNAQDLVTVSNAKGTMTYSVNGGTWGSTARGTNAGTYTVSWKDAGTASYQAASGSVSVTIGKANNPASASAKTGLVYNTSAQTLITVSSAQGSVSYKINGTAVSAPTRTDAGTYSVYWEAAGNGNYKSASGTLSVSIAKANNPASASAASGLVYNGKAQTLLTVSSAQGTVSYKIGGTAVSAPSKTDAGTYSVTWTAAGNGNYNSKSATVNVSISKYNLSNATIGTINNQTYNGSAIKPTPAVTVPLNGTTTLTSGTHFTYSYSNNTNVGTTAQVTVTATSSSNYTGSKSKNFTIIKRKLTIPTLSNGTFNYNGTQQEATFNNFNSSTMNISNHQKTNAGDYTATISIKDTNNNEWSNGTITNQTYNWKINKINQSLTINPDSAITMVRGNSIGVAYSYAGDGTITATPANTNVVTATCSNNTPVMNGNLKSGTGTATITAVNPGTTTVKYAMASTINYNALEFDRTITVLEAYYGITKNNKTIYYHKLQDALNAAQNGDTIHVVRNAEETVAHTINKNIILDLRNLKITTNAPITIASGSEVRIIGKTNDGTTGTLENTNGAAVVNNGKFTLDTAEGTRPTEKPIIIGTEIGIDTTNGQFYYEDGTVIGRVNPPYTGELITQPGMYEVISFNGEKHVMVLHLDTVRPAIRAETPSRTMMNPLQEAKMKVIVTERESGFRPAELQAEDFTFLVNGTRVVPNIVQLEYMEEINGEFFYELMFKEVMADGILVIKVENDKFFDISGLGNIDTILSDGDIEVDVTPPDLSGTELMLVNPEDGVTTNGKFEAKIEHVVENTQVVSYEWEIKGQEYTNWTIIKTTTTSALTDTIKYNVLEEGNYELRVKVNDKFGNFSRSNVVSFTFTSVLDYNAKPTITFTQEVINKEEITIHAIVKSTSPLTSADVNGIPYTTAYISEHQTQEGEWQIRTQLEHTGNINEQYTFTVTDQKGNTVSEIFNLSDVNREKAGIQATIVDATMDEKAKIIFKSSDDIKLTNMPQGFDYGNSNTDLVKQIIVYVSDSMTNIDADFEFENNIGVKTTVHVSGTVEAPYRNLRMIKDAVHSLTSVYTAGLDFSRAQKLVNRMKTAGVNTNNIRENYYGFRESEVNVSVTTSGQVAVVKTLGKASEILTTSPTGTAVELAKGTVDIITSMESANSTNGNKTGVVFKNTGLILQTNETGDTFHVTITNR